MDEIAGVLVGTLRILGIYDEKKNRITLLRVPLALNAKVYPLTREALERIFKMNGELSIGKAEMGLYFDVEKRRFERFHFQVCVDPWEFISENILVVGGRKLDRIGIALRLIKNVSSLGNKYNIIVVDSSNGFANILKKELGDENVEVIESDKLTRLLENGFGFEYKTMDDVLLALSTIVGYEDTLLIRGILQEVYSELGKFELTRILDKIGELEIDETKKNMLVEAFGRLWRDNAGELLSPGKVYVINFGQQVKVREQIQLVASFFRELLSELTIRIGREEKLIRFIIITDAEKYVPRRGFESVELANISRENIINAVANSKLLNVGLLLISDKLSMLSRAILQYIKSIFVLHTRDSRELASISKLLGIDKIHVMNLGYGEFMLKSELIDIPLVSTLKMVGW